MTTNPFYNAAAAALYVCTIVLSVNYGSRFATADAADNLLMPIGMLSLFVLSVAVMAYVFFYHPVLLFFDGKRTEAVHLFLYTATIFAGITLCIFVVGFAFFA